MRLALIFSLVAGFSISAQAQEQHRCFPAWATQGCCEVAGVNSPLDTCGSTHEESGEAFIHECVHVRGGDLDTIESWDTTEFETPALSCE